MDLNFKKMHGLGNDFVIIDSREKDIKISEELINKLSDRKTGAGCDQLITINKSVSGEDVKIDIYNPNGDRAEACGNGTRCVAKLLFEEKFLIFPDLRKTEPTIKILSDAGVLEAKYNNNGLISVNLGKLSTDWRKIPLVRKMDTLNIPIELDGFSKGVAVNIGNPHVVFFGSNIKNFDLNYHGPIIENHEFFINKTNVEIVEIVNKNKISMRVWERGAGMTLACGSGACAAVYAGMKKNLLSNKVEVVLEKGSLNILINNDEATMTGPAELSFEGSIFI